MQFGASFSFPGEILDVEAEPLALLLEPVQPGLEMTAKLLSPKMGMSDCWSTVTKRSGHPNVNVLAFSNNQGSPNASPSIGAYLVLAPEHFLLPAKMICQPSGQHFGTFSREHLQFFYVTRNLMPNLLQSFKTQVFFDMS